MYRIFSYTFEMSDGDYLDDSRIAQRDRPQQGTPSCTWPSGPGVRSRSLGAAYATARCGAFDDDLEVARGWRANPDGTDTATSGWFGRAATGVDVVERRRSSSAP